MSIRIVEITDTYINYLKQFFLSTMMDNKEGKRNHGRKYIGIILNINGFKYFAPMSSPKPSDFLDGEIRKSSATILRMVSNNKRNKKLLGTVKLNNMIPVPDSEIINYDINNEEDVHYKNIINDEVLWIQRNTTSILTSAQKVYDMKMHEQDNKKESNQKFYASIMPFKEAEQKCLEFNK